MTMRHEAVNTIVGARILDSAYFSGRIIRWSRKVDVGFAKLRSATYTALLTLYTCYLNDSVI
jgi:hypothetical protein